MGRYIYDLKAPRVPAGIGHKARHLKWLISHGYRVPQTLVVPFPAQQAFYADPANFRQAFEQELRPRLQGNQTYAVRSSANVEDGQHFSFAGQFVSYLGLSSVAEILEGVERIFESGRRAGMQAYLAHAGIDSQALEMAVILQKMVAPQAAGVAFSKNPVTGLDELVVEAMAGSSQALLQDGLTPFRWVNKWGSYLEKPESSTIDAGLVEQIMAETRAIARRFGQPVDLEWVFDGADLYWVQLRPITRLDDIAIYSNRISKEVLPGLIRPLVWSVNVPMVNRAWVQFFTELTGPIDLDPNSLARAFYYRAYFNMGAIGKIFTSLGLPKEAIELTMGLQSGDGQPGAERPRFRPTRRTLRRLPRLAGFLAHKLRYEKTVRPLLEHARREYRQMSALPMAELDEAALLAQVARLTALTQQTAYANIVVPLLMGAYNTLLQRRLEKLGADYAAFDLRQGMPELEAYDMNLHLRRLSQIVACLEPDVQAELRRAGCVALQSAPGLDELASGLERFLEQFGHFSDSGNDFSSMPWRENPDQALQLVLDFPTQPGGPPPKGWQDLSLPPVRRALLFPLYRRARRFLLLREEVSSLYTFGYGLFRRYFLALGERLARRGLLAQPGDIFYLYLEEVERQAAGGKLDELAVELVNARKAEMQACQNFLLPEIIYGDQPPPLENASQAALLVGIPSARGYYRGPVKVIRSPSEFGRLEPGDVLVIPYSDVSWTPLFARAGAVIAESGGMLSHCSIVAREYGLPCIVSVANACQLPDGALVAIDGQKGEIRIIEEAG